MTNQSLLERRKKVLPTGLGVAFDIFADSAKNSEIIDIEGNRYIDFVGGISVLNTGHSHPQIVNAVKAQLDRFSHTSAQIVGYESYVELCEKLCELVPITGDKKAFLLTTGAEAVENAIKVARAKTGRAGVIAFSGGWHGRTLLAMGLTGKVVPYKKNFGPMPPSIYHAPFPCVENNITEDDALRGLDMIFKCDIDPSEVAAMIIEPVQGEGGFHQLTPSFAKTLRDVCDKHGIVLIFDEVQCGFGRTGTLFASEQLGVEPDVMTCAKSMAGGFPISALIGRADIMDAPQVGGLGGTYAGSPLGTVAALEVIKIIKNENLLQKSQDIGHKMATFLNALNSPAISHVRHKGAMLAFDLVDKDGNPDVDATNAEQAQNSSLATADAMSNAWNSTWAGRLLVVGGVLGIMSSWNAFLIGGSRLMFAMAKAHMLPNALAKLHPKYNTPANAIILIGGLATLAPLFGRKSLVWIVDAGGIGIVIAYTCVAAAFLYLRYKEPNMVRPFKVPFGKAVGILTLIISIAMFALYLPVSPSGLGKVEWGIFGAWFVLGIVLYAHATTKNPGKSKAFMDDEIRAIKEANQIWLKENSVGSFALNNQSKKSI